MIEYWAESIALYLKRHNDDIVSVAVMKFALMIILHVTLVFAFILLLGMFTNAFIESVLALFGFALLRFFSGGIHLKTSFHCTIISIILFCLIIYTPLPKVYEIWLQAISSLLVVIFAPAYLENHVRIKKRYVPFLRIVSIFIVFSNFYWDSSILTKCFLIQSVSLIEFRKRGGEINEKTYL